MIEEESPEFEVHSASSTYVTYARKGQNAIMKKWTALDETEMKMLVGSYRKTIQHIKNPSPDVKRLHEAVWKL